MLLLLHLLRFEELKAIKAEGSKSPLPDKKLVAVLKKAQQLINLG